MKKSILATFTAATLSLSMLPQPARAQAGDDWQFDVIIYGYFPAISGKSSFPTNTGGARIDVDSDKIIDALKFAAMGTFEARKGRWGVLADVLYMDLGGSKSRTRDITIGGVDLPGGVDANASLDVKGTILELAGTYRAIAGRSGTLDLLAGTRMLQYRQTLDWAFSADLGPDRPSRSGSSDLKVTDWDIIVGAKGRWTPGDDKRWFIPYYIDVGTGDTDLTWQVIGGVGYSFGWGDVIGGWRYIDYKFKSGKDFDTASLNGPMIGAAFHW